MMEGVHLYSGSAIIAVADDGGCRLPGAFRAVVERRSEAGSVVVGSHEFYPCLSAYDRSYAPRLAAETERLRLRGEGAGEDGAAHHARLYRAFGFVEHADLDADGRIVLPPMMRRRGRIEREALFVGMGGTFEIWNPRLAEETGPEPLRELAAWRRQETA